MSNDLNKPQPIWRCVSSILKLFFKRPKIVSLSGDIPARAILLANHSAMFGPVKYKLYLPANYYCWAAWPMFGNYRSRYHYLRDVYFMQKRHKSKFAATLLSSFEALFSPWFYKGMRFMASYDDTRFITTIRKSMEVLESDMSIMIFPENSTDGYHEVLQGFFGGFVELAKYYRKKHGEDVPMYPIYYHDKKNVIVIGEPCKLTDYLNQGYTREQIAQDMCDKVNNLFFQHIAPLPN